MSFSRSYSGTAAAILAALATLPEEQKAVDAAQTYAGAEKVTELHQGQIAIGAEAAKRFVESVPDGHVISVTIGGHGGVDAAGETNADSVWLSLGASRPAPRTVAEAIGSSPAAT